jgi:5-methyltetrahydropteroyltriglutamate--homocysteine methyltransferase
VQLDEPYMQARPEPAREYGLDVLKAAAGGLDGTLAVHICFGYAAIIHERPSGYSFLPELAGTEAAAISIETAQSGLDLDVLESLAGKTIILGVLDLSTDEVETPETVEARIRRALPHTRDVIAAPDCGMKYLPRASAYGKLEALVEGARRAAG